jgi:hypothetical protein
MKKAILLIYCLLLLIITNGQIPNLKWANKMGGKESDSGSDIAVDAEGNVYTTGGFRGTGDFDPGSGIFNMTSAGQSDAFVSKFDASGKLVWVKQLGSKGNEGGVSIALDASGNVYTAGIFNDTADFDPGAGKFYLLDTSRNHYDIYVSKLDNAGNFLWAKRMGGTLDEYVSSIETDASGNVYTVGKFYGSSDFDPSPFVKYFLNSAGQNDAFISKLDANGNYVWAKRIGGTGYDQADALALDPSGNIHIAGSFYKTVDFDPNSGIHNLTAVALGDMYILKLTGSGNFVWVKVIGGSIFESPNSIALDISGNIYTTGAFDGVTDFNPGVDTFILRSTGYNYDMFVSKLDYLGNFVWAKRIGGSNVAKGNCLTADKYGNAYIIGTFKGKVDFDPGPDSTIHKSTVDDIFICKLDVGGDLNWVWQLGGYSMNEGNSIVLNLFGTNIYSIGSFHDTIDFDPNSGKYNLIASDFWLQDVFVHKMSTCQPISSTIKATSCRSYTLNDKLYSASGSYRQDISNFKGCDSTITLNLTINNANTAVTKSPNTLTANATGASYQWVKCPAYSIINGANNQFYKVTNDGDYAVIITQNSCIDTSLCYNVQLVGIEENYSSQIIRIYPNPASSILNIDFGSLTANKINIQVFNTVGQIVLEETPKIQHSQFNIQHLPDGMYFVKVLIDNQIIATQKIVKH